MRTIKAALQASGAHALLSLALAVSLTLAALNAGGAIGEDVLLGVGTFFSVVPWAGLSVLSAFPGRPVSYGLGLPVPGREIRNTRAASVAVTLLILASALTLGLHGGVWLRAIPILIALAITVVITLRLGRVLGTMGRQRAALQKAITEFSPDFVLFTGRPEGGAYQIQQWLPQLSALSPRVIIVVRYATAAERLAAVLPPGVPIVCCPENKDLDDVMLPSVRAAFYVNSVTSNSTLVNYRDVRHVYLGHGDSDKEISAHPVHRMYDAIFVAGQAAIDRYAAQNVRLDEGQAYIVGRPQLEGVQLPTEPRGLPRTVLYAPTWSGYNHASSLSSLTYAEPFVSDLLSRGIRVLFRPHPFSRTRGPDAGYVAAIDALLAADGANHMGSRTAAAASLIELFNASDAMVTDVSSVLIDYLASRKPVAVLITSVPATQGPAVSGQSPLLEPSTLYPSIRHAYLPTSPAATAWNDLLGDDPLRERREKAAAYFLGSTSVQLFEKAVLSLDYTSRPST